MLKICSICAEEKTVDDFYYRITGQPYNWCKKCHQVKTHPDTPKQEKLGYQVELDIRDLLMSKGIYTCQGKYSEFQHIDLVSWGCVKIEVKSANNDNGAYTFNFSKHQLNGFCDIYAFVGMQENNIEWLSFVPIEEMKECLERTNLIYYNNPKFLKSGVAFKFQNLIRKYRNAFELIEQKRLKDRTP